MRLAREFVDIAVRFEEILKREGVRILADSLLESALLSVVEWQIAAEEHGVTSLESDIRPTTRRRLSFLNLAHKVVLTDANGRLGPFVPHLHLLTDADPCMIGPPTHESATHKTLELLTGLAADEEFGNVELEDPYRSVGGNPDVLFSADGKRWGIACKMVSSESPVTLTDRIEEGVKQVDRSDADIGCCLVWFRSFDHDLLWSARRGDRGEVMTSQSMNDEYWRPLMNDYLERRFQEVVNHVGRDRLSEIFPNVRTPKTVVGIVESVGSFDERGWGVVRRLSAGVTQGMTGLKLCTPFSVLERLGRAVSRDSFPRSWPVLLSR
ncbi:MAG: hypothetical protein JST30_13495 [Armatimonadetes bacterium]|nr:hypothetical protein [Armatimonadota bacterium]